MRIIFHGIYPNDDEQNARGVIPARMILSDQTIRDDIAQELAVPEGALYVQIFPSTQVTYDFGVVKVIGWHYTTSAE